MIHKAQITEDEKRTMLRAIVVSNMISATLFLNMLSFYPLYAAKTFGDSIGAPRVAVAITAFDVAGIVFTPLLVKLLGKIGRKNGILLAQTILLFSNTGLGMLSMVSPDKPEVFFWISFVARFFQGTSDALTLTA